MLCRKYCPRDQVSIIKRFDQTNLLLADIPKCATNSIVKSIYGRKIEGHLSAFEYKLYFNKRRFNSFYKFSVVRNPWDRVFSAYNFLKKGGMNEWDNQFADRTVRQYKNFEDFVLNWISKENIYDGLHFIPQFEFVCDLNDKIIVDKIVKLENLISEFDKMIASNSNIDLFVPLQYLNRSTEGKRYTDNYTKEMVAHIREIYDKDIKMFDYTFK